MTKALSASMVRLTPLPPTTTESSLVTPAAGPCFARQESRPSASRIESMPSTFVIVTDADVSARELFDISLDIDAHVSSMQQSGERAIAGTTSGTIGLGETVTWRARHFGIWFAMTSKITTLEKPTRFVDQQVRGPFRTFVHEHRFEAVGDGCRMTDTITVGSPMGLPHG